jgi:cytochrome c5
MKNTKLLPLTLFALTMVLVTTGCSAPVEVQEPQVEEPAVVDEAPAEPKEIRYGDIVVSDVCQAECFDDMKNIISSGGDLALWDAQVCHLACEADKGNL